MLVCFLLRCVVGAAEPDDGNRPSEVDGEEDENQP